MKVMTRVLIRCSLVGLMLVLGACATGPENDSSLNFAAAFGWGGYADTDMTFSEFFESDHTLVARFMPQYPRAYAGPIFAENGAGTFFVGQQSHTKTSPRLVMAIGSQQQSYEVSLSPETWHHIAVVRSGNTFRLYLDGERLQPDLVVGNGDAMLPGASANLRLARRTSSKTFMFDGGQRVPQFYGFIDDVAVFDHALSDAAVETLNRDFVRLDTTLLGDDWGLAAAWTFDSMTPTGGALPSAFDRPVALLSPSVGGVTYEGVGDLLPAQKVPASQQRNGAIDAKFLLPPFHQATYTFPTKSGQAWRVTWGNNTLNTHFGYAAFTWDIILASTSAETHLESASPTSCDQPLYALASGELVDVEDDVYEEEWKDGKNNFKLLTAPDETASYLHILTNSVTDAGLQTGDSVQAGQLVARVGTRKSDNCHLHFGVRSETVTIPVAFTDYEASDDNGVTWYYVSRGVPQHKQWIRTVGENFGPSIEITEPSDGSNFWYGGLGEPFAAEASDVEDGPSCCGIGWYSNVDGFLGPGATNNLALSPGEHIITARAQDSDGAVGTDSITVTAENIPPTVSIIAPAEGDELVRDTPVVLGVEASDVNEPLGNLCASAVWTSSVAGDPSLGGCSPQATFATNGPRTLTVTVTDEHGLVDSASVTVTVVEPPPTGPPIVTILQPQDGAGLNPYDEYTLEGTATDPDGESTLIYEWTAIGGSGSEYAIGVGATLSWTPSDDIPFSCGGGEYGLRLEVTDPDGDIGQDSIDVSVIYPPC